MSITAAMGIPKFDTGPQKSAGRRHQSVSRQQITAQSKDNPGLFPKLQLLRSTTAATACAGGNALRFSIAMGSNMVFSLSQADCIIPKHAQRFHCSTLASITKRRVLSVIRRYRGDCPMTAPEEVGGQEKLFFASRTC